MQFGTSHFTCLRLWSHTLIIRSCTGPSDILCRNQTVPVVLWKCTAPPVGWTPHLTCRALQGPSLLMQPGSKDKGLAWPLPQGMSLQRLLVMLGSSPQTERQRDREANAAGGKEATPPEMGQQTSLWRRRSLPLSKKTPRTLEPQHPRVPQGLPSPSHHDVRDTSWACFSLLPQFR